MKKILITSFEPFGGQMSNASYEVVKRIKDIEGVEIIKENLPVVYDKLLYLDLLDKYQPDFMLLCGQAGGRNTVDIEQVAINLEYSTAPDNEGTIKTGEIIFDDGVPAFFATIPAIEIVKKLQQENLPVKLSLSAGGYICNMSFYSSIYYCEKKNLTTKIAFIHFPFYEGQIEDNKYPTLNLDLEVEILNRIIKELI